MRSIVTYHEITARLNCIDFVINLPCNFTNIKSKHFSQLGGRTIQYQSSSLSKVKTTENSGVSRNSKKTDNTDVLAGTSGELKNIAELHW